jgi:hypothetical protein
MQPQIFPVFAASFYSTQTGVQFTYECGKRIFFALSEGIFKTGSYNNVFKWVFCNLEEPVMKYWS